MPPFATNAKSPPPPLPTIVTLNVGGQTFQTTPSTLALAGPSSILAAPPPFIDRDPALFAHLLSFLRTARLPCPLSVDLLREAEFYRISLLPATPAPLLHPLSLRPSLLLPLPGRDPPSSLPRASPLLHVPHGPKISSFDASLLLRTSTLLTPLPSVDHLAPLPAAGVLACGATDFPGLHVVGSDSHLSVLHWTPYPNHPTRSTVAALEVSPVLLFSSFDSCRRNANVVATYDLPTLRPAAELARQDDVSGAEVGSAIPASKLRWAAARGLLMAAGSYGGPFGLVGSVRLWDVRSGQAVWEAREREDCFADVAVSDALDAVVKVGAASGDLYMADMRMMSEWCRVGRWAGGGGGRKGKEGAGCRLECFGDKVLCSRGGEVEMWSEVVLADGGDSGDGRIVRSNVLGSSLKDGKSKITGIGFVGNRMALVREGEVSVELWETCVEA